MKIGNCIGILRYSLIVICQLRSELRNEGRVIQNLLALLEEAGREDDEVETVLGEIEAQVEKIQKVEGALQNNFEETNQKIRGALDFSDVSDIHHLFKILRTKLLKAGTPTSEALEFADIVELLHLQHRYLSHMEICKKQYIHNEIASVIAKAKGVMGEQDFRMHLHVISSRIVLNEDLERNFAKLKEMQKAIAANEYIDPVLQKDL
ncbi:MAG: hypothetical protein ACI9S8_001012 [Chlamydiales bacterium]|jgi:hypothetical protein